MENVRGRKQCPIRGNKAACVQSSARFLRERRANRFTPSPGLVGSFSGIFAGER